MPNTPIYLATVCLDPNRWGSRQPSLNVSDWLERIVADGFAGVELWEYHFTRADEQERARLMQMADHIPLYNTYAGFTSGPEDCQKRDAAADAIEKLGCSGVKYNVGGDADSIVEYREMLLTWDKQVPESCRLLCECHPGTVLEEPDAAAEFFEGLDPQRFGIIAHLMGNADALDAWLTTHGDRLQHLHLQHRDEESDPTEAPGREKMAACVEVLKKHNYAGSASIEFTRGMGREEQIKTVYANALADRAALLELWQ